MKRILIITHQFLPDIDGGITVAYEYANLLVELGYDVTVLSKEYSNAIRNTKFHYLQVPNRFGKYLWMFNFDYYLKSLDLDKFDCIILNQCPIVIIAGKYFGKKLMYKSIVLVQGLEVEYIYKNERLFSRIAHWVLRMKYFHRKALIDSRKVVSVSEFHKWKVIKAAKLEQFSDKFQVIYTGLNKNIFYPVSTFYRQELGWEDKELLVTVSRIEKMKGFDEMLDIFEQIIHKDDSYRWLIIGDGSYFYNLKQFIINRQLTDKIHLLGSKPREELKSYYSMADCFWLLSNYDETFGLVYLEAQACGIPAIGRNKGGVKEAIVDGKTGFLINNKEECIEVLLNKKYKAINTEDLSTFVDRFDKIEAAKALIS